MQGDMVPRVSVASMHRVPSYCQLSIYHSITLVLMAVGVLAIVHRDDEVHRSRRGLLIHGIQ